MYLVDTCIISAGAPSRPPSAELLRWMDAASANLFISVVTIAEIEAGIAKAARTGATRKTAALGEWLAATEHLYGSRILPIDIEAAHVIGRLLDKARSIGQAPGWADIAIAGTALARGLTILTRNITHFTPLGVPVIDPYRELPANGE